MNDALRQAIFEASVRQLREMLTSEEWRRNHLPPPRTRHLFDYPPFEQFYGPNWTES